MLSELSSPSRLVGSARRNSSPPVLASPPSTRRNYSLVSVVPHKSARFRCVGQPALLKFSKTCPRIGEWKLRKDIRSLAPLVIGQRRHLRNDRLFRSRLHHSLQP